MRRQSRATLAEWSNSRLTEAEVFLSIACSSPAHSEAQSSSSRGEGDQESSLAQDTAPGPAVIGKEARIPTKDSDRQHSVRNLFSASKEPPDVQAPADLQSIVITFCSFLLHIAVYSLVVPFVCTLAVVPLLFEEVPYEIWESYYWVVVCGTALCFSETFARRCLGFDMNRRLLGFVCAMCASITVATSFTSFRNSLAHGFLGFAAVMIALYAPAVSRFVTCVRKGAPLAPLFWYIAFMTWGATPTAISVLLYYGLVALEWKDDIWMVAGSVAVWSVVPFFVKAVGWKLAHHGSPKAKFFAPLLWVLYCDLAFGTLGLPLFMHRPRSSLTYAASIVPILFWHMARGAGWLSCCRLSWCCFCRRRVRSRSSAELRVMRMNALLEAQCAVQGRAVAYTVYFTMMALNAIFDEGGHPEVRYSLMLERQEDVLNSVNIYRYTSSSALDMLAAVFGLCASWGSFCLFAWLLPYAWGSSTKVAPADSQEAKQSSYSADSTSHDAGNGGWMFGGDRGETLEQQRKVILSFLQNCKLIIVTEYAFQLAITSAAVNMAEFIIFNIH